MNNIRFIGFGGFLSSIRRYIFSGYVQGLLRSADFPYATMAVNITGCLMIGILSQLAESRGAFTYETCPFWFIDFLGGFTTFSTFGNETMNLFRESENMMALVNVVGHIVLSLGQSSSVARLPI